MSLTHVEVNFDGLVGPTHNFAGLAVGNIASMTHRSRVSSPRRAALEGLAKMKLLMDLGQTQAIIPPQPRPDLDTLRRLGFYGSDSRVVEEAHRQAPALLAGCYSASSMWTANACTVSPAPDTHGGKVHFTPANLVTHFHRSIEPTHTRRLLEQIFPDDRHFVVHQPLPAASDLGDEGAANHLRLAPRHESPGLEIFVYGRDRNTSAEGIRFMPRQSLAGSQAVARLHRLEPEQRLFVKQNQAAIDAGVFHNDVISMAHLNVLIAHERAFEDQQETLAKVADHYHRLTGEELLVVEIPQEVTSLDDAVRSYLFNSQIVTLPDDRWALIAPSECQAIPGAARAIRHMTEHVPGLKETHYVSMTQSMWNGGGPGCTRLRVVLSPTELARCHRPVFLTGELHSQLVDLVERHYPESLAPADLADPALIRTSRDALSGVYDLLKLTV